MFKIVVKSVFVSYAIFTYLFANILIIKFQL